MDSFITLFPTTQEPTTSIPENEEKGGGSGSYCVVAQTEQVDIYDEEKGGGSGSYCVIA